MCSLTLQMRALGVVTCDVKWLSVVQFPPHSLLPSGDVGLAVYVGDAAVTATSRQPTLVISQLERWLRRLEDRHRRLDDYRRVLS
jgi:hypothetical protein